MIGQATAGGDIKIIQQPVIVIDEKLYLEKAKEAGYVSPEAVAEIKAQLARPRRTPHAKAMPCRRNKRIWNGPAGFRPRIGKRQR